MISIDLFKTEDMKEDILFMSEFKEIFNELCRTQDRSIIWNNWLDYCININLMQTRSQYAPHNFYENEEEYYQMFTEWIQMLNNELENHPYIDFIGRLYEDNVQSKGKAKDFQQYYTPTNVTTVVNDLIVTRESKGFASDPCCGSGRMLLAAHVKSQGKLICVGQDLDETSCKMAVLNFLSHGVRGSVLHMNTLEGTFYKGWRVNRWLLHGIPVPHIEEIYNPGDAYDFIGDDYERNKGNVTNNPPMKKEGKQTTLI